MITRVECLAIKVEQLSPSLSPNEKDVLQRQVDALNSDLKLKMKELKDNRKKVEEFEYKLRAVASELTEFEEKLSKEEGTKADLVKVKIGCNCYLDKNYRNDSQPAA